MRTKRYAVRLSGEERSELRGLIAAGTESARKLMHARILLKADEGPGGPAWVDERIADGERPPPTKIKFMAPPNQIELSPDSGRLYLIANWQREPGRGVWVVDASTGAVVERLMADTRVTGIAVAPDGAVFVASPDAGGRLWVVPAGDARRQRLLRDDLGDRLAGVVIAS